MTQQQSNPSPKMPNRDERPYCGINLTYRQALGILHRMSWDYLRDIPFERYRQKKALFPEAFDALRVLSVAILGAPGFLQYSSLCEVCHEAYAECYVQEKGSSDNDKGSLPPPSYGCCKPCRDRLLAEGKILPPDGTGDGVPSDHATDTPQDKEHIPQ